VKPPLGVPPCHISQTGPTSSSLTAQRVRASGIAFSFVLPELFIPDVWNSPKDIFSGSGLDRIDSGLVFHQTSFFLTAFDSLVIAFSWEKIERFS
jgi:hypothetical protein